MAEELVNDIRILLGDTRLSECRTIVYRQLDATEISLTLIRFSIIKRFGYKFVTNEKTRITSVYSKKKDTHCPSMLQVSRMKNTATLLS